MSGKVIQGSFPGGQPNLPLAPIQTKTATRPPGPPAPAFARRPGAVQRHGAGGAFAVEPAALGLASGGGRPLPDTVRGKMEAALGADFSNVRVHVGPQAERIGAIAFTIGSDIYFAPGRYQPDAPHGQQLLGHELAHVVQQRAGRVKNPLGSGLAVVQDTALEAEADRLGRHTAAHRVAAQAKMKPSAAHPSSPVRISPPISAGPGSYRFTAGAGGRQVGSVMVHARDKGAVEVTDLSVAEAQRGNGVGKMLLASAARTGQQFGKSKVSLAAQDKGSGQLTQWYKGMGFTQIGVNQRGCPQLEAPISHVLAGTAQRRETRDAPFCPYADRGSGHRASSLPVAGQGRPKVLVPSPKGRPNPGATPPDSPTGRIRIKAPARTVQRMISAPKQALPTPEPLLHPAVLHAGMAAFSANEDAIRWLNKPRDLGETKKDYETLKAAIKEQEYEINTVSKGSWADAPLDIDWFSSKVAGMHTNIVTRGQIISTWAQRGTDDPVTNSDVLYHSYQMAYRGAGSLPPLKIVKREGISNKTTLAVMAVVRKFRPDDGHGLIKVTEGDPMFFALLGTPNGKPAVHLLRDWGEDLQITGITAVEISAAGYRDDMWIYFN